MKSAEDLFLKVGVEIDEKVSADQEIDMRNGRVLGEIATTENNQPPYFAVYAKRLRCHENIFHAIPHRTRFTESRENSPRRQT